MRVSWLPAGQLAVVLQGLHPLGNGNPMDPRDLEILHMKPFSTLLLGAAAVCLTALPALSDTFAPGFEGTEATTPNTFSSWGTLTATLPACAAALAGIPVHVLSANDYLVKRDAEAMRPVYAALGLSIGAVRQGTTPDERRPEYAADITYCSNKVLIYLFIDL